MSAMKRVLLISYFFPPISNGGVFRPLKMAKYLPRNGWEGLHPPNRIPGNWGNQKIRDRLRDGHRQSHLSFPGENNHKLT